MHGNFLILKLLAKYLTTSKMNASLNLHQSKIKFYRTHDVVPLNNIRIGSNIRGGVTSSFG